ncbi:hypothetical protein F5X99DRAFT_401775, partial [Biscogniauxia marginata]
MQLVKDFGIDDDHSLMHHDSQPYYAADMDDPVVHTNYNQDPETWIVPMKKQRVTKVVEIPV